MTKADMCQNPDCDNKLSASDIANGMTYCSEECGMTALMEHSERGPLFDDPEDEQLSFPF